MIHLITYLRNNEKHTMEWIAPIGWSAAAITADFERRFEAQVIRLEPQP